MKDHFDFLSLFATISLTVSGCHKSRQSSFKEIGRITATITCADGYFDKTTGKTSFEVPYSDIEGLTEKERNAKYCGDQFVIDRTNLSSVQTRPLVKQWQPFSIQHTCVGHGKLLLKIADKLEDRRLDTFPHALLANFSQPAEASRLVLIDSFDGQQSAPYRYISKPSRSGHRTHMTIKPLSRNALEISGGYHDGDPFTWPYDSTEESIVKIESSIEIGHVKFIETLKSGLRMNVFLSHSGIELFARDRETFVISSNLWPHSILLPVVGTTISTIFRNNGLPLRCSIGRAYE